MDNARLRVILKPIAVITMVVAAGIAVSLLFSQIGLHRVAKPVRPQDLPPPVFGIEAALGSRDEFSPEYVLGEQPPITEFKVIPGSDVEDEVDGDELVIGVVVNDQARAYPINGLCGPNREILNDTLGGQPIAATW